MDYRILVVCLFFINIGSQEEVDFDEDVSKHFIEIEGPEFIEDLSLDKPVMVLVTQPWCGACKNLKRQVNSGTNVKLELENFAVVFAEGNLGKNWQHDGHSYVP